MKDSDFLPLSPKESKAISKEMRLLAMASVLISVLVGLFFPFPYVMVATLLFAIAVVMFNGLAGRILMYSRSVKVTAYIVVPAIVVMAIMSFL